MSREEVVEKDFMVYRCKSCGRKFYPRHDRCPYCRGMEFEEVKAGDTCTLITYTKLYILPEGIEMPPLTLGIVDFGEGVRALGQIMTDNPRIGMKLKPVWGFLRKVGDKDCYGFKFKPIEEEK